MELLELNKIWDKSPHNAFTDLIYFKEYWYCAFREASTHMSFDGVIRIIRSKDTKDWESVTFLELENLDLRDPKFSITPKKQLMVNAGIRAEKHTTEKPLISLTWFSLDGINYSKPNFCSQNPDTWRWSTTWHNEVAYSFAYTGKHPKQGALYTSLDGKEWSSYTDEIYPTSNNGEWGNEASITFIKNKAYCLLRRDNGDYSAVLASSTYPYKSWNWENLGQYVGGPKLIDIDGKLLVGGRLSNGEEYYTALAWVDVKNTKLEEVLRLPSKADSSYPGLEYKDGIIYMSYYSSHEAKSAIYFAKIKL